MKSELLSASDAELRFGEWGPGYLSKDPQMAVGAVVLRPGDEFGNHLHRSHTESFIVLEGRAEIWIDQRVRFDLAPGHVFHAAPGEEHYLRNVSNELFRAVFIKTPWVDDDKVDKPWRPAS